MQLVKTNWLDGVTSATATDAEEVLGASTYVLQVVRTGSPTTADVVLQGSIDGTTWHTLGGGTSAELVWITGKPVKYIRVWLVTLSGGTSPTVSASVIAL